MYYYLYDAMYAFVCVLYAIITDPGTVAKVQGLGFSLRKPGVLHVFSCSSSTGNGGFVLRYKIKMH
jgi:hypothetical protein